MFQELNVPASLIDHGLILVSTIDGSLHAINALTGIDEWILREGYLLFYFL